MPRMTILDRIAQGVRDLPAQMQQEVLAFVQFLAKKQEHRTARKPLRGILAQPGLTISAEDIDEARRELWGMFPREDV